MRIERNEFVILYGFPASLYTAKLRSFLIKKGIPFIERHPGHRRFREYVAPTCGSSRLPIIEHPDGAIIQDTNDIIARLDRDAPELPVLPETPLQKIITRLINLFADEALLKQAMHFRWNTTAENRRFIEFDFGLAFAHHNAPSEIRSKGAKAARRFSGYLPFLGVNGEIADAIEAVHLDLLERLERHFAAHPYLMGGHPSLADYALMGPLYAHLTRDPHAGSLLYERAPRVLRWTEEMNGSGPVSPDHPDRDVSFEPHDRVPETLEPILSLMFETFAPELAAFAGRYREFIAANPNLPSGSPLDPSGYDQPSLAEVEIDYRGARMRMVARMFPLWLFQPVVQDYRGLLPEDKRRVDALLDATGGSEMMSISLPRALSRRGNRLVLGDEAENA